MHSKKTRIWSRGFSLVELMVAIALLSILGAIAIPLYNGYVLEGHLTGMRATMNGMRTHIEAYRLENGDYGPGDADMAAPPNDPNVYGWRPTGDTRAYTFAVTGGTTYSVTGSLDANTQNWVRCCNRFRTCFDSQTTGSATPVACP